MKRQTIDMTLPSEYLFTINLCCCKGQPASLRGLTNSIPVVDTEMEFQQYRENLSLDDFPLNAAKIVRPMPDQFPEIVFSRERLMSGMADQQTERLVPVNVSLTKRFICTYMDRGLLEALAVGRQSGSALVVTIANRLISFGNWFHGLWATSPSESTMKLYTKLSQTRNWPQSVIRALAWHPHLFKLAVATVNDTVYIYTLGSSVTPVLNNSLQKSITCLAWRPNAAGELAIGCENGVLIWSLDPVSQLIRPVVPPILLKHGGSKKRPVSTICWNKNGDLLVSASVSDPCVYVWDVDLQRCNALHHINHPCAMASFRPNGGELLVTTVGRQFYIGGIKPLYKPAIWILKSGSLQSFAFSKKDDHFLYVTTDDKHLFYLQLGAKYTNTACSLVDLKRSKTADGLVVGGYPQSIVWCPLDQVLAIAFKDTPVIAVFITKVEPSELQIYAYCFIAGVGLAYPCCMEFQENYSYRSREAPGSVLSVGWSSGSIAYYLLREHQHLYS